ncbi:MAG: hypothetical protein IKG56_00125 [Clostridia bacterium]|nr:hypothetical protein [Clostridia bacterium]
MEENKNNEYSKVPVKTGFWQSFKAFWLQPVVIELTPYQKKVFNEVRDFWNQEIHFENGSIVLRKAEDETTTEEPEVKVSL